MSILDNFSIPFNKPAIVGKELEYIQDVVTLGHSAGDGNYTRRCNTLLEQICGAKKALLTTSCTHALEMAGILLDLQPGDEVILPSFTFVSTANAFILRGARPVFVDIREDTLNIDERKLEERITDKTKAIVVVHYAGVSCAMDEIMAIASAHQVPVVEDNAHGLFGAYKGRALGSFGIFATQSFHETKNIHCGEGGALLVNDSAYLERAEIIREKGTNRSKFFRGEVDKYTWVDTGSSYLPSDFLAAYLCAQLECADLLQKKRSSIWNRYQVELASWATTSGVRLPVVPDECEQAYHLYYMIMPSEEQRNALLQHLRERNIMATFHYIPLHTSPMGEKYGYRQGDLPVTESMSARLLRLPLFYYLTDEEQQHVIDSLREFTND
jgi:dTDP-4-amino-4,6-dideoxygalactose transaminase